MAESHHQRALELGRTNASRRPPRYRSLLLHWLGRRFRRLAPARPVELVPVEPGQLAVTWGGHATCLLRYAELGIVFDPLLARSVSGIRRERMPGLEASHLVGGDLVLISSAQPDHLDVDSVAALPRAATVVVPPGAGARLSPLRFRRLLEVGPGGSFGQRGVEISVLPVKQGRKDPPAQAYLVRGNGPSVYLCGQTGYFDGFAELGRSSRPDVALLPIAGYWPPSFRERRMSPLDALQAFEDLKARVMIPIAFGAFAMSYERLHDPERWLAELVAQRGLEDYVVALEPGESRVFVPPPRALLPALAEEQAWAATALGTSIEDAVLAAAGAASAAGAPAAAGTLAGAVGGRPAGSEGGSEGDAASVGTAAAGAEAPPVAEAVPEVVDDAVSSAGLPGFEDLDTELDAALPDPIPVFLTDPDSAPAPALVPPPGGWSPEPAATEPTGAARVAGDAAASPAGAAAASPAGDAAARVAGDAAASARGGRCHLACGARRRPGRGGRRRPGRGGRCHLACGARRLARGGYRLARGGYRRRRGRGLGRRRRRHRASRRRTA